MITSCGPLGLPKLMADFHAAHPAVEITLSEANSNELIDAVRSGTLDAAVIGLAESPPRGLDTQVVTDEPIACAVSTTHPLAGAKTVKLAALADHPLISLPVGTGIRARFEAACAVAGFQPPIAFEASDPHLLAELAGRGLGVAILPSSILDTERPGLAELELTDPPLRGQLAFAWRASGPRSPAAEAFVTHARTTLSPAQPARAGVPG
jgi:DNA-binding transcriptional LysR family regulator